MERRATVSINGKMRGSTAERLAEILTDRLVTKSAGYKPSAKPDRVIQV